MKKKFYIKPEIEKVIIDYSISLLMETTGGAPDPPTPVSNGKKSPGSDPFASPFSDRPFK
jgi:hypothetical protein